MQLILWPVIGLVAVVAVGLAVGLPAWFIAVAAVVCVATTTLAMVRG
jgi:hypothetical protein